MICPACVDDPPPRICADGSAFPKEGKSAHHHTRAPAAYRCAMARLVVGSANQDSNEPV